MRKVRSLMACTFVPLTASTAEPISSACCSSIAWHVTSMTMRPSIGSTTSSAVTSPPASLTAVAMEGMSDALLSATRMVMEYDALGILIVYLRLSNDDFEVTSDVVSAQNAKPDDGHMSSE